MMAIRADGHVANDGSLYKTLEAFGRKRDSFLGSLSAAHIIKNDDGSYELIGAISKFFKDLINSIANACRSKENEVEIPYLTKSDVLAVQANILQNYGSGNGNRTKEHAYVAKAIEILFGDFAGLDPQLRVQKARSSSLSISSARTSRVYPAPQPQQRSRSSSRASEEFFDPHRTGGFTITDQRALEDQVALEKRLLAAADNPDLFPSRAMKSSPQIQQPPYGIDPRILPPVLPIPVVAPIGSSTKDSG